MSLRLGRIWCAWYTYVVSRSIRRRHWRQVAVVLHAIYFLIVFWRKTRPLMGISDEPRLGINIEPTGQCDAVAL